MTNLLYDSLFSHQVCQDQTFLHLSCGGTVSYAKFRSLAARYAQAVSAAGLVPGDRLAAQISKSPQALILYAACVQAGVIFLPLNTAYTVDEVRYLIEDSASRMLVCDPGCADALAPVAAAQDACLMTLGADGTGTLAEAAFGQSGSFKTAVRGSDDIAALLYTSGTTGRSKGAMLSHGNLVSNASTLAEAWRFKPTDVLLHALPLFHTHGLFVATNVTLAAGASMILLPRFDTTDVLRLMLRATVFMGIPTFYTRLLEEAKLSRELTSHMRLFVSGSAPLLADTHERFESRTGHRILERYGMTETNMNTSNPYEGERRAGTVGMPLRGIQVKVTDPATGDILPQGETGQIEVRGPNVFKGYWRMPEKTAAELRENGFFVTGDLGRFDDDGYLHIVGRDKDLIISGGYNIYPKEIEVLLDAQPSVLESVVVGVPHSDFGETPLALIVAEPGAQPDLDAIQAATRASLARYKHPRAVLLVDALPRNAMGKVQRNVLRDRYRNMFVAPA